MNPREPLLKPVPIMELRPTQITVGLHEVEEKRKKYREQNAAKSAKFLGHHMIPTVLGPKGRHYVIDNHHLARALHDEGVKAVLVSIVADVSALPKTAFWIFMENKSWAHTYDAAGRRVDFSAIPNSIDKLVDDPYRSLAGDLRHAGGYAKDLTPFSEFLWADFLRARLKVKAIDKDYRAALTAAVKMAKSEDASYLPGWCGVNPIA